MLSHVQMCEGVEAQKEKEKRLGEGVRQVCFCNEILL